MKYLIVILSLLLAGCGAKVGDRKEYKVVEQQSSSSNYKVVVTNNNTTTEYLCDYRPTATGNYVYIYPIDDNIRFILVRVDHCIVYELRGKRKD